MSISGDPLDGLKRYIEKKSLGLSKVQEFLKTLEEAITDEPLIDSEVSDGGETITPEEKETVDTPAAEEDVKKNKQEKPVVQVIGYVDSIRKIQTKKGDNMLIVMCSSTGWKFTVVVFPKFYDQIAPLIKSGEIILVKGRLNCKIEMREISIEGEQVKRSTISDLRTAAKND